MSDRADLLCFASVDYVRRLSRGAQLLSWSVLALILLAIGGLALGLLINALRLAAWPVLVHLAGRALVVAALAGIATGLWWLTSRDPQTVAQPRAARASRLSRVLFASSVLGLIALRLLGTLALPAWLLNALSVAAELMGYILLASAVMFLEHLRELCERLPHRRLSRQTHKLRQTFRGALVILLVTLLIDTVVRWTAGANAVEGFGRGSSTDHPWGMYRTVRSAVQGITTLVVFLGILRLIGIVETLARPLARQAEHARRHWQQSLGGTPLQADAPSSASPRCGP